MMRIEASISTLSWIPSDLMDGMGQMATRMGIAHHDPPPPRVLGPDVGATLEMLRAADRFRFANVLSAFIEVDGAGRIVDHGTVDNGTVGGVMGATTVRLGVGAATIPAVKLDDLCGTPVVTETSVTYTQTVGGRTGAPMPRAVKHAPFVQYHAPIVWTTLELVLRADGTHTGALVGASEFPRHWVYDHRGALVAKSSVAAYKDWMNQSFGRRTPWGAEDSPALVSAVETLLERELQEAIMRGGPPPRIRRIKPGQALLQQGVASDGELYLLLNGVLVVEVDATPLAEVGPGAVLGERAAVEGGHRTATLRAVTECKVAAVPADQVDLDRLVDLAAGHRREATRP